MALAMGVDSCRSHCFRVELGRAPDGKMLLLSISVPSDVNAMGMEIEEMLATFPKVAETVLMHGDNLIYQDNLESLGYSPEVSAEVGYVNVERFSDSRASSSENVRLLKQEVQRLRRLLVPNQHHNQLMAMQVWCKREAKQMALAMGVDSCRSHCFRVELGRAPDGKMLLLSISVPSDVNAMGMEIEEMLATFPKVAETVLMHGDNLIYQDNLESLGYSPEVSAEVGYVNVERFSDSRASSSENVRLLKQEVQRLRRLLVPNQHHRVGCVPK